MHGGVRRLLLLTAAPTRASIDRLLGNADRLALASNSLRRRHSTAALVDDCIAAAVDEVMRATDRCRGPEPSSTNCVPR